VSRHGSGIAIVALLSLLLSWAFARAQTEDPQVAFAADVEKCKAHLGVSAELYAKRDRAASLHASHPIQEIGNKVIGPASNVSPTLGDKVRAALRRASGDLKSAPSPAQYDEAVSHAAAALDEALAQVVPGEKRASLGFRARVLADLLLAMSDEYQEAYRGGKITQQVEYQDAYAFFKRAQALYRNLTSALRTAKPAAVGELDGYFAGLARALPGLTPPDPALPADRLKQTAAAAASVLRDASRGSEAR
jgi:hypothetical protein